MKKKATLLIKDLDSIYTMKTKCGIPLIFHHAYIAIHHDVIVDISEGSYAQWVDKDTRIIDGKEHYAMPAWIECHAQVPTCSKYDVARVETTHFYEQAKMGTLHHHLIEAAPIIPSIYYELHSNVNVHEHYPIVYVKDILRQRKPFDAKRFCISAYDACHQGGNQLLMAQLLKLHSNMDDETLMKALTIYPAKRLQRDDIGVLEKGKYADVLILHGTDCHHLFSTIESDMITHVIKSGVRIFPYILI